MAVVRDIYRLVRYQWQLHYLLPLLLLVPLFVLFSKDPFGSVSERGTPVVARISQIGVVSSRYQGKTPGVAVTFETVDGAIGRTTVPLSAVRGCRIGDSVEAEQNGIRLYLKPKPCRP